MDLINSLDGIISAISNFLYSPWVPLFLVVGGFYLTFRTGFVQFKLFKESIRVVKEKPKNEKGISSFGALMMSTASRVGTGNIIGVSTSICLGGVGSIFWMWAIAIIGGASAFVESTLAQIYKKKNPDGTSYGGPAYYMESALKQPWLGMVFAVIIILTYAVGYNALASFNLQSTFAGFSFYDPESTPLLIGVILTVLFAFSIMCSETGKGFQPVGSLDGRYLHCRILDYYHHEYWSLPCHDCQCVCRCIQLQGYFRWIQRILPHVRNQAWLVLQRGWYGFCSQCRRYC